MLKLAELLMAMVTLKKTAQALVSDCKSSLVREAKLYGSWDMGDETEQGKAANASMERPMMFPVVMPEAVN